MNYNKNSQTNGIQKNINYNSIDVKSDIIDYLYTSIDINKHKYYLLRTFDDLKQLKQTEHHVSPNFSGKNCFIIFKKIKKVYYSIIVDRQTLKYNKVFVDLKNVKFIPFNVKAKISIYNGTILDCKRIKINDNQYVLLITDVFYLEGKDITSEYIKEKLDKIKIYLDQNIKLPYKFTFDVNKLYDYNRIKDIVNENKNNKLYNIYGIIFYPKKSGMTLLFNDLNLEEDEKNDNTIFNIQLKKGNYPDVYDTFILNEDNKLAKSGIAYIPTLKLSQYCEKIFLSLNDKPIIFKCKYNNDYQKWEPIENVDNITKPDTIQKIKKYCSI